LERRARLGSVRGMAGGRRGRLGAGRGGSVTGIAGPGRHPLKGGPRFFGLATRRGVSAAPGVRGGRGKVGGRQRAWLER
jgi:nicotinamide mononucleotide (NMN) deamidase PncC